MSRRSDLSSHLDKLTEPQKYKWVNRRGQLRHSKVREDILAGLDCPNWLRDIIERDFPGYLATPGRLHEPEISEQITSGDTVEDTSSSRMAELPELPVSRRRAIPPENASLDELQAAYEYMMANDTSYGEDEIAGVEERLIRAKEGEPSGVGGSAREPGPSGVNIQELAGDKRKFSWFLSDYTGEDDELNEREGDGSLKDLGSYPEFVDELGNTFKEGGEVPAELLSEEFLNTWRELNDINGKPFYDAESNALGTLPKDLYMLIPSNWSTSICDPRDIGSGSSRYKLPVTAIAGVYALAKAQCKGTDEEANIKWAVLRMEAFKAGWYNRQKYCIRKTAPSDSLSVMTKDWGKIKLYAQSAWNLSGFIPFLSEYCFRAYGSTYNASNAGEYIQRAEKLATSAQLNAVLNYLPPETLYGTSFRWIGMQRPMHVLAYAAVNANIPNVFKVRISSAPSGQALITSSATILKSLKTANWWAALKQTGGYDETLMMEVAEAICQNPWQYHYMSSVYGLAPLSEAEQKRVSDAREFAITVSPILQAYVETILKETELGKVKAIHRAAQSHTVLMQRMKSLFQVVTRKRARTLDEAFSTEMFGPPEPPEQAPAP